MDKKSGQGKVYEKAIKNRSQEKHLREKLTSQPEEVAFDLLFQSLPVPMFLLDEDRRIYKMTHAAQEHLRKTAKESQDFCFGNALNCVHSLQEHHILDSSSSCKECSVKRIVWDVFQNDKTYYRQEVKLAMGEEKRDCFLIISATSVDLPSGRKALLYFEDITERRQVEDALKVMKDNLNRAQAVAHIGSWHLDIVNNILVWSDETYRMFGLPIGSPLTYEKFLEIVHPDDRGYVDNCWKAALNKKPYDIEHRIVVGGKLKWVREKAQVEFNNEGKAISGIGTVQDISERKQREEDSRKLQEELMHVSRVATMGEFTAALAHELNQPLMAIMSNAQAAQRFLAKKKPDLNEIGEILSDIIKDDKRASGVITKLRALLKKSEFEFMTLNINDVIQEVISLVHSDIVIKNISLSTELNDNIPLVRGDRIQLEQVILNLILNSCEAMKDLDSKRLCIRTVQENDKFITVGVKDSGIGIDEKNIERLFKPFFTTKKEGLGMGLSINKAIIETHGGSLWAKNNPDRGATFFFSLPIHKEHSE